MTSKTIVITGAAQGIGAAAGRLLAEQGNTLILADRNLDGLEEIAASCRAGAAEVHVCPVDIADRAVVQSALGGLCRRIGRIDALVNAAGIADENEPDDAAAWDRIIGINLGGTYNTTQAVLPYLADGGRIVNVSSILGRAGKIRNTAYCASKHGVLGFTKGLALDLAARKITVNAILPAWVDTPMLRQELARQASVIGTETGNLLRNARRAIPLRRLIEADETAALINFLLSDAASAITAQGITIDAGFTCGV